MIPRISIIPLIPFLDSSFRLLQITNKASSFLKYFIRCYLTCQLVFPLLSIPKLLYSNPDRIDNKGNTSTNDSHVTKIEDYLKAHRQIFKKRCFEKYCPWDKACQFPAL